MHDDETNFLEAIAKNRSDDVPRLIYADWLEERGDIRAEYLRFQLATQYLSIDHACWPTIESGLSQSSQEIAADWIARVTPVARTTRNASPQGMGCNCYGTASLKRPQLLHQDVQDAEGEACQRLQEMIAEAVDQQRREFAPLTELGSEPARQIVTLPASIGNLVTVEDMTLYGSCLTRIPPEIGRMTSLAVFRPYTSYSLHWFPYEITRCTNLRNSSVSTRALYGNYKFRSPFPALRSWREYADLSAEFVNLYEQRWAEQSVRPCSVCNREFRDEQIFRYWISLQVATDVLPLLVNACSQSCIDSLPQGAKNHVRHPHQGGSELVQPAID